MSARMNGDGEVRQTKNRPRMDVRGYLLAEADRMIRANGFEAFTLARLSDRIGMRISSIQGHFPTREDLGNAVVDAYLSKLTAALDAIEKRSIPVAAKLSAYSRIFRDLADGQIPPHDAIEHEKSRTRGSLAERQADLLSVQLAWLERAIDEGKAAGDFDKDIDTRQEALRVLSSCGKPASRPDSTTKKESSGRFLRASGGIPTAKDHPDPPGRPAA